MLKKKLIILTICLTVAILLTIGILVVVSLIQEDVLTSSESHFPTCGGSKNRSKAVVFRSAAVTSDAKPCSRVAIDILKKNGTAVDASIAAMFCIGIYNAQSCGVGGGFVATIYSKKEGKAYSLDSREAAPKAAHPLMYEESRVPHDSSNSKGQKRKWYETPSLRKYKGGLAVAVPGEVDGLYEMYRKFGGGVPWTTLLDPAIKMCEEGYQLSWYTAKLTYLMRNNIINEPSMSIFKKENEERVLREGETVYRKKLALTLRSLQKDPKALKEGPLATALVRDLQGFGGVIAEDDLRDYRPKWKEPLAFPLINGNFTVCSFPPPGSGFVLGLALKLLDQFNLSSWSLSPEQIIQTHLIMTEAFKFSYAQRYRLGDLKEDEIKQIYQEISNEAFIQNIEKKIQKILMEKSTVQDPVFYGTEVVPEEDGGTAHFSLLAPNGDAVSITSSINMGYGAGVRSESTGVIFNNHMADFTIAKSNKKAGSIKMIKNTITPGNRPLSSMAPTIVLDSNGDVKLIVGAAGGIKIPSGCVWVASRFLWMGQDLADSVDSCRTHHSLIPMTLIPESGFPNEIIEGLKENGHIIGESKWKSVVSSVGRMPDGSLVAHSDFRKSGGVSGL